MTHHHQPRTSDDIARLESELLHQIAAGNRLPATDSVRLNYARARMRREIQAQRPSARLRARTRATLAPALAGAAALWAVLAGLLAAHPIAAAGLAAALVVGGGVAADVANLGPPILENVGLQRTADQPPTAPTDAPQQTTSGAPLTAAFGLGNGSPASPPDTTHGLTVATVARSNIASFEINADTHGGDVSCIASTQGQAASTAARPQDQAGPPPLANAGQVPGRPQICDDSDTATTPSANDTPGSRHPAAANPEHPGLTIHP